MFSPFTQKTNYTSILLFILVGLSPLIYVEPLFDKTTLPRFAFISFLILPAFLFLILNKLKPSLLNGHSNILFFSLFVFFSAVSISWGHSNGYYEEQLIKLLLFFIVFLIGTQSTNLKQIQILLVISIFSASIVSLIGILQKFYLNPFDLLQLLLPASTFINKNYAANYIDLIIPINFILLVNSNSKQKVWLLTFSLSLLLSYILIIHSRGSWLALIVFFFLVLISARQLDYFNQKLSSFSKKHKLPLVILFFIPTIIFLLPGEGMSLNDEAQRYSSHQGSTISIRKNANLTALDMIQDKPILGFGLGNFHIAFRSYARSADSEHKVFTDIVYLHNDILQTFVELGIMGGGILLLFFGNTVYLSFKLLKDKSTHPIKKETTKRLLALGLLLSLLASSTHALVSFPLHQAIPGFIFYLWLGLLTSLLSKQFKITQIINFFLRTTFIISLLFMVYAFSHYSDQIKSNFYINQAILSLEKKNCSEALKYVDKSINYYAKDYYPQRWAVSIYAGCDVSNINRKRYLVEKILSNNPLHPWALKMAATLYFKQEDYLRSEQALRLLTGLFPSIPATYIELGNILYKQKKYVQAHGQYLKSIGIDPTNALALKMLKKTNIKINLHKKINSIAPYK